MPKGRSSLLLDRRRRDRDRCSPFLYGLLDGRALHGIPLPASATQSHLYTRFQDFPNSQDAQFSSSTKSGEVDSGGVFNLEYNQTG